MSRPKDQRTLWIEVELQDGCVLRGVMNPDLLAAEPWKGIEIGVQTGRNGMPYRWLCILRAALKSVVILGVNGKPETVQPAVYNRVNDTTTTMDRSV